MTRDLEAFPIRIEETKPLFPCMNIRGHFISAQGVSPSTIHYSVCSPGGYRHELMIILNGVVGIDCFVAKKLVLSAGNSCPEQH